MLTIRISYLYHIDVYCIDADLLHGLALGSGADARDGKADVDGGADAAVEELRLEEDLDRNR